jgi:peptidoglycan hydrolase-like amidase
MAALKAQAIAARSYALTYYFKPAHSLYNIGDDESYQVYAGADKEADTTYQAVDQTAGEFISYRGGIVESLYAASDDIVIEAHGGRGMSQLGALKLAEEGYDYRQILGTYYPGTGLARIEVDHR